MYVQYFNYMCNVYNDVFHILVHVKNAVKYM